jgi:hypothetical protein
MAASKNRPKRTGQLERLQGVEWAALVREAKLPQILNLKWESSYDAPSLQTMKIRMI